MGPQLNVSTDYEQVHQQSASGVPSSDESTILSLSSTNSLHGGTGNRSIVPWGSSSADSSPCKDSVTTNEEGRDDDFESHRTKHPIRQGRTWRCPSRHIKHTPHSFSECLEVTISPRKEELENIESFLGSDVPRFPF